MPRDRATQLADAIADTDRTIHVELTRAPSNRYLIALEGVLTRHRHTYDKQSLLSGEAYAYCGCCNQLAPCPDLRAVIRATVGDWEER